MTSGQFEQGRKKTGGRKRGSSNKLTTSFKEAIEVAFDELGGVKFLVQLGQKDPRSFAALVARIIPTQIQNHTKVDLAAEIIAARRQVNFKD